MKPWRTSRISLLGMASERRRTASCIQDVRVGLVVGAVLCACAFVCVCGSGRGALCVAVCRCPPKPTLGSARRSRAEELTGGRASCAPSQQRHSLRHSTSTAQRHQPFQSARGYVPFARFERRPFCAVSRGLQASLVWESIFFVDWALLRRLAPARGSVRVRRACTGSLGAKR